MKKLEGKILKVRWIDAAMEFNVDKDEVNNLRLPTVETVGKCVLDRTDLIAVASEELPHEYRAVTMIPSPWVEDIKILKG